MRPGSPCVCNRFGRARRRRRPRQHPGPRPTGVHGRRRGPEAAVALIRRSLSPNRRPSRLPHGRGRPGRPGRAARPHICCLSDGTDGVSPAGGSAAEDAWSALTRRPAATPLRPTPAVCHARGPSGERRGGSIPRPPARPAPLADPPTAASQPAHTRFRRAERQGRGPPREAAWPPRQASSQRFLRGSSWRIFPQSGGNATLHPPFRYALRVRAPAAGALNLHRAEGRLQAAFAHAPLRTSETSARLPARRRASRRSRRSAGR